MLYQAIKKPFVVWALLFFLIGFVWSEVGFAQNSPEPQTEQAASATQLTNDQRRVTDHQRLSDLIRFLPNSMRFAAQPASLAASSYAERSDLNFSSKSRSVSRDSR